MQLLQNLHCRSSRCLQNGYQKALVMFLDKISDIKIQNVHVQLQHCCSL